jgi:ParB family chromosome partitioning protein
MAGMPTLACVEAKGDPTPEDLLEDQLVENAIRSDLKPVEQGRAFKALVDRRGWSYRQLADRLHISHQVVVRAIGLLELPEDLQADVDAGKLAPTVAYEVSRLDGADEQRAVAEKVVRERMNRDDAVRTVRQRSGKRKPPKAGPFKHRLPGLGLAVTVERTKTKGRPISPDEIRAALEQTLGQIETTNADAA